MIVHFYTDSNVVCYGGSTSLKSSKSVVIIIIKSLCNFLLIFHCNCMPVFYRFWDVTIYRLKICVFPAVLARQSRLKSSQWGFPWDLEWESWSESWATRWLKPHDPTVIGFESIAACVRQTDRRTDTQSVAKSSSSPAERDKLLSLGDAL